MKPLAVSLLMVFFLSRGSAQEAVQLPVNEKTGRVTYEGVFDAKGTKAELLDKALAWFKEHYRNPSQVIQSRDTALGKITGKHKFVLMVRNERNVPEKRGFIIYTIKIWTKDNKVRYMITDIHKEYSAYLGIEKWMEPGVPAWKENQQNLAVIDEYMKALIKEFTEYMTTEKEEYNEDDW